MKKPRLVTDEITGEQVTPDELDARMKDDDEAGFITHGAKLFLAGMLANPNVEGHPIDLATKAWKFGEELLAHRDRWLKARFAARKTPPTDVQ